MSFWAPNLGRSGRLLRAGLGLALLAAAWPAREASPWLAWPLALGGAFALLEAARGWCLARACGLRTRG
jgi:hypothetical protein